MTYLNLSCHKDKKNKCSILLGSTASIIINTYPNRRAKKKVTTGKRFITGEAEVAEA
jgi:hypothetical protein